MGRDRIPVVVADNDAAVREALADLVDAHDGFELAGVADDHEAAVRLAERTRPRVMVMDVHMPRGDAPGTVRAMRARTPPVAVVALSAYGDPDTVLDVLAAGAYGYVVKGAPAEEIIEAVTRAARGQLSVAADLALACMERLRRVPRTADQSERTLSSRLEESFLDVLTRAPFGVLVVGSGGRVEFANAYARHAFGYSAAELRDKELNDLLPAGVHTAVEQLGGRLFTLPSGITCRRRDGTEFPVRLSGGQLRGVHPRTVVFLVDLSAAHAAENSFRQLVEGAPDALLIVDPTGRMHLVNQRAEALFGYGREDMIGMPVGTLLPDEQLTTLLREWAAETVAPPIGHSMELVGRRQDAKQFPADVSLSPLRTDEGAFTVLTVRDITEVQRAQFVLERSLELLEGTDRDRQALLSHLIHAQEEERRRIAADIHDDTIQVITAVGLRLQQLRKRLQKPEEAKIMDRLEETLKLSLSRLRQLIFDLRPSSLEHGSLSTALHGYLEQLRADTGTEVHFEDRLDVAPPVETMVLIYRTAQEALMNVRKHARAKNVRVQVLGLDDGCLMRIVDDGVGYDPLEVESRPGHLGLALIHERAQMAGGWSRVESTPGAGTTVEFWVPLTTRPSGPTPPPADDKGAQETGRDDTGKDDTGKEPEP